MHFLHILSYSWENGGASKVVYDLAKYQIENGHEATIMSLDIDGHVRYKNIEGVNIVQIKGNFFTRFLPLFSPDLWEFLKTKSQTVDIIHHHGLWNFTLLAAHLLGLHQKSIVTVHGCAHPYTFIGNKIKRGLFSVGFQKRFLEKVKMIHVLHVGEEREIEEYLGKKTPNVYIIPNGIEVPDLKVPENKTGNDVLFLSRLHKKKGLDLLLPAFKLVLEKIPDAKLLIAGPDFGMKGFVEGYISDNKMENSVKILGPVNGQAKIDLLLNSKVFALPSYSEGFSIAVLEALVYELPIVASTETGLSNDISETKSGIIIELNPNSVAKAIIEILDNENLAKEMAKNGKKLVSERFETEVVCRNFHQIVEKVFV
ncbi:glycosyltransferase [Lacihabitans sp. LS3-19]|uniref:glycosyltransferase n=1 Tax=Lacihabitans sp. LS3-19 TaxID=2487335 RepID=UPI0020CD7A9C|nr:glycosyltransferase [Lacihabitans sp. LS3-19]MCP9768143.1 glycosyltransferase [Lacihabitans sp. LS3-19]